MLKNAENIAWQNLPILYTFVLQAEICTTLMPKVEICVSTHVALRIALPLWQPVNYMFWSMRTLNWLVAASKLHKSA